jgi:hypothetical protein
MDQIKEEMRGILERLVCAIPLYDTRIEADE